MMIRDYEPRDIEDLMASWEAASAIAHPFVSEEFLATERHNIPNVYMQHAKTSVWEAEGKVVGFIAMIGDEIGGLFVHPAHQRSGIGGKFLEHVRQQEAALEVQVFEANTIGRSFYDRSGFKTIAKVDEKLDGHDLLRMRLDAPKAS